MKMFVFNVVESKVAFPVSRLLAYYYDAKTYLTSVQFEKCDQEFLINDFEGAIFDSITQFCNSSNDTDTLTLEVTKLPIE